jgi:tRNA threonylcarbamoyladenosine biosynthesis protein TsaE
MQAGAMNIERRILSEDQLPGLATELISFSRDNKLLAFFGEMGAGKTTFIKAICKKLGVDQNVTSPTFSIVNEYVSASGERIYHFDFYRIERESEAVDIGCEEYFESGFLCLIEWPEKIINLLPHPFIKVTIIQEDQERRFTFSYD